MTLVAFGDTRARTPWPGARHHDEPLSPFERRAR